MPVQTLCIKGVSVAPFDPTFHQVPTNMLAPARSAVMASLSICCKKRDSSSSCSVFGRSWMCIKRFSASSFLGISQRNVLHKSHHLGESDRYTRLNQRSNDLVPLLHIARVNTETVINGLNGNLPLQVFDNWYKR